MATSSIPTLKSNLVSLLQARGGLAGVEVVYGPPLPAQQREFIAIGLTEGEQDWLSFGAQRKETYDQAILISVLREGTDAAAADTRCFTLYAELENQVRSDNTISGAVSASALGAFTLGSGAATDGMSRTSTLTVRLHCQAFI